ncbi:hypothetical protein J1N35_025892 [Gossypium stocksii]|uniref:Uncharacterized protein n=1 Tax=Gossypium stocksii TaxID=47602 RepID=A0A9D3ZY97_9ROSI|nr:hypothetical protein J1N35_025892 [Gossypium stocksii]
MWKTTASTQETGTSFAPHVLPRSVNIPDEDVCPLMEAMIRAFQQIFGANPAPTPANLAPVTRGLLFELLRVLGGKEFSKVKGTDLIVAKY